MPESETGFAGYRKLILIKNFEVNNNFIIIVTFYIMATGAKCYITMCISCYMGGCSLSNYPIKINLFACGYRSFNVH